MVVRSVVGGAGLRIMSSFVFALMVLTREHAPTVILRDNITSSFQFTEFIINNNLLPYWCYREAD